MSAWGKLKPTNSPNTVWGDPGWVCCETEWNIKVPGHPNLLQRHHQPTLEVSTCPTKNECSSKNCTQLDTLRSDILHTIDTRYLSLVHHETFKKVLAWIKHQNPVLHSTRSYKLKYIQFDNPMHDQEIFYVWANRCLAPYTPLRDLLWEIRTIKHKHI